MCTWMFVFGSEDPLNGFIPVVPHKAVAEVSRVGNV